MWRNNAGGQEALMTTLVVAVSAEKCKQSLRAIRGDLAAVGDCLWSISYPPPCR